MTDIEAKLFEASKAIFEAEKMIFSLPPAPKETAEEVV
jgi:hypothetical protein